MSKGGVVKKNVGLSIESMETYTVSENIFKNA